MATTLGAYFRSNARELEIEASYSSLADLTTIELITEASPLLSKSAFIKYLDTLEQEMETLDPVKGHTESDSRVPPVIFFKDNTPEKGHYPCLIHLSTDEKDAVIGCVYLKLDEPVVYISSIYLDRKIRGKGLGKVAILKGLQLIKTDFPNLTHASISYISLNKPAAKSYRKLGFKAWVDVLYMEI